MVSIQAPQIQVSDAGGLPFKGIARYGKVQCINVYFTRYGCGSRLLAARKRFPKGQISFDWLMLAF